MAKIMIVDDDEGFGALMKSRLEQPGIEVGFHRGGFGSLNAIRKSGCDLVILGMNMLGMPAMQLTQLLRQTAGIDKTKVLLAGSASDDTLAKAASDAGAEGYISKEAGALDVALRVKTLLALAPESMRSPARSGQKEPRELRDPVAISSTAAGQRRRISNASLQQMRPDTAPKSPSAPPPATDPTTGLTPQRRSWGRLRASVGFVAPPIGASTPVIGAAIAPFLRDTAARLLLGALRIHESVILRGVTLEEGSLDLLATLSTLTEPLQAEHEAARAAELARFQTSLGAAVVDDLRREAGTVAAFLLHGALLRSDVSPPITAELLDECWAKALPGERSLRLALDRYARAAPGTLTTAFAARIIELAGGFRKPAAMTAALNRLLSSIEEDSSIAAGHAKQAIGV